MPWLVNFSLSPDGQASPSEDPLADHELLVSELWDLGTLGVVADGGRLIAGFDRLDAAERAAGLAPRHNLVGRVESIDDSWVRREPADVTVTTTGGTVTFPIVAGPAFGHGSHPTTRLALELMSEMYADADGTGEHVLDLGTGSGVLAIAAHHLGADRVVASDIDAGAIDSARYNASANGVVIDLVLGDVDVVASLGFTGFDLILANVLLVVHERVAQAAMGLLAPGGSVVVAGFLDHQSDRLLAAYQRHRPGLRVDGRAGIDDWAAFALADRAP